MHIEASESEANKRLEQEKLKAAAAYSEPQSHASPQKHAHDMIEKEDLKTHLLAEPTIEENNNAKYVINNETVEKRELETPKAGLNPGTRNM
jgi:hypothetical protein